MIKSVYVKVASVKCIVSGYHLIPYIVGLQVLYYSRELLYDELPDYSIVLPHSLSGSSTGSCLQYSHCTAIN